MRNTFKKTTLSLALATGLIGSAAWSTDSHACAYEPLISSVCAMAMVNWGDFGGSVFAVADGRLLPISQYAALYSLIGQTYGGSGQVSFAIPDLRGRVVVGSGTSPLTSTQYVAGQKSGSETVTLTNTQLPQHIHALTGTVVDISKMTATTTLSGLTTTTNLANVPFTSSSSSLTLKGSTGGNLSNSPSGATLGSTSGIPAKIYSDAGPTVAMAANSVTGTVSGTLSGT
ncbi:MAG: tail fiber protein, partial [Gallionella sp.]